jgi:hypothetical protein
MLTPTDDQFLHMLLATFIAMVMEVLHMPFHVLLGPFYIYYEKWSKPWSARVVIEVVICLKHVVNVYPANEYEWMAWGDIFMALHILKAPRVFWFSAHVCYSTLVWFSRR